MTHNGVAIDRSRLEHLIAAENATFLGRHRRSAAMHAQAQDSLLGGVPMNWMTKWPGAHPIYMASARGSTLTDVDGNEFVDFCLGDTGAMAGHSPPHTALAVRTQAEEGITSILPTAQSAIAGEELKRRFGLPQWQIAMTATEANRSVLRIARHITGRPKTLVFNWCYHGTLDETMVQLGHDGQVVRRVGVVGPITAAAATTRVVEFNDVDQLEEELAHGDVACVLAEPAMTNIGIIAPDPGFHEILRDLTRRHGVLLVNDETHTFCCGEGGFTREHNLDPDIIVVGKPIGGGVPAAAYGMTHEVVQRIGDSLEEPGMSVSGVGGTLSANALAVSAVAATLANTLTAQDFARMIPLASRWCDGVASEIDKYQLGWSVTQLGARAEYCFGAPPRNGSEAITLMDEELEIFLHLWCLNRGVLMTPFHNMALISPASTSAQVDLHTRVFGEALDALRV